MEHHDAFPGRCIEEAVVGIPGEREANGRRLMREMPDGSAKMIDHTATGVEDARHKGAVEGTGW
jgi:hypothetical protein